MSNIKLEQNAIKSLPKANKKQKIGRMGEGSLHVMLIPAVVLIIIYHYLPMYGIVIAFQDFMPFRGLFGAQEWIGWDNFKYIFTMPDFQTALLNTLTIASLKIVASLFVPVLIALLLNEMRNQFVKRSIQTLIYLPHFLSWVILSGILTQILMPSNGIINNVIKSMGFEPIFFLGDNRWFQFTLVMSEIWKDFGWGTILYLAAITGIDPSLYEAAYIDGAGRWKQTLHVTLPGMAYIILLKMVMSIGHVLNAGFDQVLNLQNPMVYKTGDIIDTLVYRVGLIQAQFGVATAIGLFKSAVALVLITFSYWLAYKTTRHKVF